jgi:hypothetical protein
MPTELPPDQEGPKHVEVWARAMLAASGGLGSAVLELRDGYEQRRYTRAGGVLAEVAARVDEHIMRQALLDSEELESVFWRALRAGANSMHAGKRQLLGRAIAEAMLDEAKIDEAVLITSTLERIDTPEIKALERIHQAELAAHQEEETLPRAEGAPREINPRVGDKVEQNTLIRDAAALCHARILAVLISEGLIETAAGFGGGSVVVGVTPFGSTLLSDLREPA